jgi:hypothetical protein
MGRERQPITAQLTVNSKKMGGSVRSLRASLLAAAAVTDTETLFKAKAGSEVGVQ